MKKALIIVGVVLALLAAVVPYYDYKIEEGFKNNSPDDCMDGAMLKQRIFSFHAAMSVYKKVIKTFPEYKDLDKCYYYIGLCYEKTDEVKKAIEAYEEYLSKWPKGNFAGISAKRISSLKANQVE